MCSSLWMCVCVFCVFQHVRACVRINDKTWPKGVTHMGFVDVNVQRTFVIL